MLTARDQQRLQGVHPDLIRVVTRAAQTSPLKFAVLEGLRTRERQAELLAKGATRTMNSRHITGHAVDLAPLVDLDGDGDTEISWRWPHYHELAKHIKAAALLENVMLEWGGDWKSFPDGPHWQLPRSKYP